MSAPQLPCQDAAGPVLAECEPEMYRIFAYAILADHRRRGERCSCGAAWPDCEVNRLADQLLIGA